MEKEYSKLSGYSLMIGSLLMVITMVLHPSGGNIEHILKIKTIIIVSHSLAILSIPFVAFGFWGFSTALINKSRLSVLSFAISCLGLFAVMIAATINGLTLPLYLSHITQSEYNPEVITAIIRYGTFINNPMDYIFMFSLALSICIWSVLIIRSSHFQKWIGYYGIAILIGGVILVISGINLVHLAGFRIVVFLIVSWIVIIALRMIMHQTDTLEK